MVYYKLLLPLVAGDINYKMSAHLLHSQVYFVMGFIINLYWSVMPVTVTTITLINKDNMVNYNGNNILFG